MAETLSTMLSLGTPMPAFSLTDAVSGRTITDRDAAGAKGTLVMFICNHCPFVQHVLPELERLAREYDTKAIRTVAINSNDLIAYPQDGPGPMKELAVARGWTIPFLFDDDQSVAKAYHAACTPDFFAFDGKRQLAYRGRREPAEERRPGDRRRLARRARCDRRRPGAFGRPGAERGMQHQVEGGRHSGLSTEGE